MSVFVLYVEILVAQWDPNTLARPAHMHDLACIGKQLAEHRVWRVLPSSRAPKVKSPALIIRSVMFLFSLNDSHKATTEQLLLLPAIERAAHRQAIRRS